MHELDFTKGRAAIAFAGETPWHGHGAPILPGDSLEIIRKKAGLDYTVHARPLFFTPPGDLLSDSSELYRVKDQKALVRNDTGELLSIVGARYKVVQPGAVLEFFRDLLHHQGLSMEVAGALDYGRKVWALARIDDQFSLHGADTQVPYVLIATSYDGTLATTAMLTSVRVVCMNTLRFSGAFRADGSSDGVYRVRHDQEFVVRDAHGKLGLNEDAWLEYQKNLANLASFQLSEAEALEYFYLIAGQGDAIVRNEDNGQVISFPEPSRVTKQFINAYLNGPGAELPGTKGTLWGALNAVTFYQDHVAPASDRGARFNSATFGGGNQRKQHAYSLAIEKMREAA
jgi:phage/plasmid-like protein (TIGR03299 family)